MPVKRSRISPEPPKVPSTIWVNSLTAFDNEAPLTPTVKALFVLNDKPIARIEHGADFLEWELDFNNGIPADSLSSGQIKEKKFENIEYKVETSDYLLKETITLNSKPISNIFKLKVSTNLEIKPEYIFGDVEEFFTINFGDVFRWEPIEAIDDDGLINSNIRYGLPENGYIPFIIDPDYLDNAKYPVKIDPPTSVSVASTALSLGHNGHHHNCTKLPNGEYIIYGQESGTTNFKAYISSTPDTPNWTDESGSTPFGVGVKFPELVPYDNSDCLFIGGNGSWVKSALRLANGDWDIALATVESIDIQYGTESLLGGDGNAYCMSMNRNTGFSWKRTINKGVSWVALTGPGIGSTDTRRGYALVADKLDADKIHLFYQTGASSARPRHIIYSIIADSWSGDEEVTINAIPRRSLIPHKAVQDSSGVFHYWYPDSSFTWYYVSGTTGSFTDHGQVSPGNKPYVVGVTKTDIKVCIASPAGTAGRAHVWDDISAWSTEQWFTAPSPSMLGAPRTELNPLGEELWFAGKTATNTYYSKNPGYNWPSGADETPPTITGLNPDDEDTGVAIDTTIYFELDDDSSGVDEDTITVTVDGNPAITNGVDQSGYSSVIAAEGLGLNVTITPDDSFDHLQEIEVVVDCDDIAGNPMVQEVYSFTTVADLVGPTGIEITSPAEGQEAVQINHTITSSAGSDANPPISYFFQVDTVNTFDSGNLQESGWIAATSWQPSTNLTVSTTYYTRVKGRDSAP